MNIITRTMITSSPVWPVLLAGILGIGACIGFLIWMSITKNYSKAGDAALPLVFGTLGSMMLVATICGLIKLPTGRYRYTATLDNSYTANELFENYTNITYSNGVYTFEDKEKS